MPIHWKDNADKGLRGTWGNGSKTTDKRAHRDQRQLKLAASQSYSIDSLFARQKSLGLHAKDTSLKDVPRACSPPPTRTRIGEEDRKVAAEKLDRLLRLPTEQKKKYGSVMDPRSSFHLRHRMVLSFLWLLRRRDQFPGKSQRELGYITAHSFGRGTHTGKLIVNWTDSWVRRQEIPNTNRGRNKHNFSWMDDEDVVFAARGFCGQQGESEYIVPSHRLPSSNSIIELSSYKLAQFVAEYLKEHRPATQLEGVTPQEVHRSIQSVETRDTEDSLEYRKKDGIRSRTARKWLHKLGYSWKTVRKGVFIDGHERADVLEDRMKFLQKMKELEPLLVEFDSGRILEKSYPDNCQVGGPQQRPTIIITHDESVFSANDGKREAWIKESESFLRPKGKGQGIMVSDFLLPWGRLNLKHLTEAQLAEAKARNIPLEAVELFEFGKQDGYWDGARLLQQVSEKALPIAQFLYPGFDLVFMFDNATSHSVYAADALRVANMCLGEGHQQAFLRPGWYQHPISGAIVNQPMWTSEPDPLVPGATKRVQKGIKVVLQERGLWPSSGLLLECKKPKCDTCKSMADCQMCVKGTRCQSCKEVKQHSGKCSSKRQCDECVRRKERCQCVRKEYCPRCSEIRTKKCVVCESLPPKCTSNSQYSPVNL
jgi:hypothetical protein